MGGVQWEEPINEKEKDAKKDKGGRRWWRRRRRKTKLGNDVIQMLQMLSSCCWSSPSKTFKVFSHPTFAITLLLGDIKIKPFFLILKIYQFTMINLPIYLHIYDDTGVSCREWTRRAWRRESLSWSREGSGRRRGTTCTGEKSRCRQHRWYLVRVVQVQIVRVI